MEIRLNDGTRHASWASGSLGNEGDRAVARREAWSAPMGSVGFAGSAGGVSSTRGSRVPALSRYVASDTAAWGRRAMVDGIRGSSLAGTRYLYTPKVSLVRAPHEVEASAGFFRT